MVTVECNILYCFESSSFAILFFIIKNFDCFGLSANFAEVKCNKKVIITNKLLMKKIITHIYCRIGDVVAHYGIGGRVHVVF